IASTARHGARDPQFGDSLDQSFPAKDPQSVDVRELCGNFEDCGHTKTLPPDSAARARWWGEGSDQPLIWRSISSSSRAKAGLDLRSAPTFSTALITVVWCLPPKPWPIAGKEASGRSLRQKYMATARPRAMGRSRLLPVSSSGSRP